MSDRFRKAARKFWQRAEEERWIIGRMGRRNPDLSFTFDVPGRKGFVYVTIRTAGNAQTSVPARNDAGVPHNPDYIVKMRLVHGVYVIDSKTGEQTQGYTPPTPPSGLEPHADTHQHGGDDEVASVTPGANAIPKAGVDGTLDIGWINLTEPVQDIVGAMLLEGDNITITYDDVANTITIEGAAGSAITDTDELPEGVTNLYHTAERVQDVLGAILADSSTLDFTYDDGANTLTVNVIQSGIDHGSISGLGDDDHPQYVKDTGDTMTGELVIGRTTDGNLLTFNSYTITEGSNTHQTGFRRGSSDQATFVMVLLNAANAMMGGGVNGDSFRRILITAGGEFQWGSGSASRDTNLYRSSANHLKTDDDLIVAGDLSAGVDNAQAKVHVMQGTLGNEVLRLQSESTGDDPTEQYLHGRVATTDSTATTIITIPITASNTYMIEVKVIGRRTGGTGGTANDGFGAILTALYTTVGGVVTSLGYLQNIYDSTSATGSVDLIISGTNVLVQVDGEANNNITWHAFAIVRKVSS